MSSRVYLFFPLRGHEPPPTLRDGLNPHPVAFQSPALPNARMSHCTQSVHSFSFPPRPLRTAPSRFPNTTRFGSRPPLIRISAPPRPQRSSRAQRCLNALAPVISRARLHEVIRKPSLLRCAPMMRSNQDPVLYGAEHTPNHNYCINGVHPPLAASRPRWSQTVEARRR